MTGDHGRRHGLAAYRAVRAAALAVAAALRLRDPKRRWLSKLRVRTRAGHPASGTFGITRRYDRGA